MIVEKENPILRKKAAEVLNIADPEIKKIIEKMSEAMFKEPDGIGIAAPQIGRGVQIFLVAKDLFTLGENARERKKDFMVFINPKIKKFSQRKLKDTEGCLSVRGVYGEVPRAAKLSIEYVDENGKKHTRGASGLLARIIQHEIDHLNGVLFIDKARNIKHIA